MPGRRARRAAAALLLTPLLALSARASEPELLGFGVRGPAMAGTGVAFADDFEAVYDNPAGLIAGAGRRLWLGYVGASHALTLDGKPYPVEATSALQIGIALPLPLGGALKDRLALGVGLHLPTQLVNRARAPFAGVPTLLLDSRTQTVSVMAALSARLFSGVRVGVGVLALAALGGTVDLVGLPAGGGFSATSEEKLTVSAAPLVGLGWTVRPRLRLGAVYRGESASRYDLLVRSDLVAALPLQLPTLRIAGVSQYDPHTAAVEVAVGGPDDGAMAALQLQWQHWSAMPPPVLAPTVASVPAPPPGLRDTATVRLGLSWSRTTAALRTTLRAGYAFIESPAPDAAGRTLLDAHRHVASVGLALGSTSRRVPLRLDGFYQVQILAGGARAGGFLAAAGLTLGIEL